MSRPRYPFWIRAKIAVLGFFGAIVIGVLYLTMRWARNDFKSEERLPTDAPYIATFWHGRQLLLPPLHRVSRRIRKVFILISQHSDGRLIATIVGYFGLHSVVGSSSRGAINAARHLVEKLEEGHAVTITPDGPRGPIYQAKEGVVRIAQLSGRLIYPMAFSASSFWTFNAWDRIILPKPFSRGVFLIGDSISIPPELSDAEIARYRELVTDRLNAITAEADRYFDA